MAFSIPSAWGHGPVVGKRLWTHGTEVEQWKQAKAAQDCAEYLHCGTRKNSRSEEKMSGCIADRDVPLEAGLLH